MRSNSFKFGEKASIRLFLQFGRTDSKWQGVTEGIRTAGGGLLVTIAVASSLTGPIFPGLFTLGMTLISFGTLNLQSLCQLQVRQNNLSKNTRPESKELCEENMQNLIDVLTHTHYRREIKIDILRSIAMEYDPTLYGAVSSDASRGLMKKILQALSCPDNRRQVYVATRACCEYCLDPKNHGKRLFTDIVNCANKINWEKIKKQYNCFFSSPQSAFTACKTSSSAEVSYHSTQEHNVHLL